MPEAPRQNCEKSGCPTTDGVDRIRVQGAFNNMDIYAYLCPQHREELLSALATFGCDKPVPRPGHSRPPSPEQEAEMERAAKEGPRPHPKVAKAAEKAERRGKPV